MIFENNKAKEIQIAYIGGGSRGWAWTFMTDLATEEEMSGTIRLYDIDEHAARNNEIIGNHLKERSDVKGKWDYTTCSTLEEALSGVNFVVISILPGTFDEMESDVHEPEKYGIYQSVGDTAGPGGLVRGLRTIPMFKVIAEAIKACSPDAWVINYTNPMAICMKTLYEIYPQIKAFGCCHEVFGTQTVLANMCQEMFDVPKVSRKDIYVNVLGVNHFTWFDKASYKGYDLFPAYKEFIDKYYETGFEEKSDHWMNSSFACAERVKFDLFRKYGLIAAAGDRHLVEFLPPTYLKDPETVKSWKFALTTVAFRKEELAERLARSERLAAQEEEIELKETGEEGIQLIKAIIGLRRMVSNVNIPNMGQITNLPKGTIVETNALFERDSVKPIFAGEIPSQVLELIKPHVQNQEDILKAALTCNMKLALKAFMNEPLVTLEEDKARELLHIMIHNNMKYLPDDWAKQLD